MSKLSNILPRGLTGVWFALRVEAVDTGPEHDGSSAPGMAGAHAVNEKAMSPAHQRSVARGACLSDWSAQGGRVRN